MTENFYPNLEDRLRPLAEPLAPPRPGDWLAEHHEKGQTFRQYLAGNPVRRDGDLTTIYLCVMASATRHSSRSSTSPASSWQSSSTRRS